MGGAGEVHARVCGDGPAARINCNSHVTVCIKGEGSEHAVLCTPTTTYALKMCETSNSVLLLPPSPVCRAAPHVRLQLTGAGSGCAALPGGLGPVRHRHSGLRVPIAAAL